jgi:hypothetical protein
MACGGFVGVENGSVLWGSTAIGATTPAVDATGCGCPPGGTGCFFTATANGITVTAAGIAAGVTVLVYVFHNGTFPSGCQTFGSKNHWALACGSSNPSCGQQGNCI